jgi:hypothetical protein
VDFLGLAALAGKLAPWGIVAGVLWWAQRQARARDRATVEAAEQRTRADKLLESYLGAQASRRELQARLDTVAAERAAWERERASRPDPAPGGRVDLGV